MDSPETLALFDRAFDALFKGDLEGAAKLFDSVARISADEVRAATARTLKSRIELRLRSGTKMPQDELKDEESGRSTFLAQTLIVGLNYGWMLPLALNVDDEKAFAGTYLITAGAAFTVPYLITRNEHITRGMSTLSGGGAFIGVAHGAFLYGAFAGEDGFDSDNEARAMFATMLAASVTEGSLGYLWARNSRMAAGEATAITAGSVWGLGYALGTNYLIDDDNPNARVIFSSMLVGSLLGGFGGKFYSDNRRLTEGDASITSYAGILGAYAALAPVIVADTENGRVIAGSLMAGAALGLVGGDYLTRDADYSRGQAGLVALGSLAGGLLGGGGGFLIASDDEPEDFIIPGSAAGALAGFLVMLKSVDPTPEPGSESPGTTQLAPMMGPNGEKSIGLVGTF